MNKQFLSAFTPLQIFCRTRTRYKYAGGIRYPGGIVYYPRDPNFKDPEIVPSKLFKIERIKPVKGTPWFLRKILEELHIAELERVAIVKNIPEINARLWKIKHLIKVTPITFPFGEPSAEDINYTVLNENGECIVTKKLEPSPDKLKALDSFDSDPKKMDSTTIKKDSRHKWNNAFTGGF